MARLRLEPQGRTKSGAGSMRVAVTSALVLVAALTLGVSTASAAPLSMTFTEARADVGVQLSDHPLLEPPATAPFEAQIDSATGTITDGVLDVPDFSTHITDPIVADVTVEFDIGVITGNFTAASGALTLKGEAGGTLVAAGGAYEGEECFVSTAPELLELSTAGRAAEDGTPPGGTPFAVGLTGPGAIAGEWTDMHADPVEPADSDNVEFCENVEGRIGGPGGIWLEQDGDLVPPAAPQLTGFNPASPNQNGTPRILGTAEPGSTVRIHAGSGCTGAPIATGSAAELSSPGIAVTVAAGVTATFSASAVDAAQNTSACSTAISYTRPSPCVVPKLRGKTLKQARRVLRSAHCRLGKVRKPARRAALVVKRSFPGPGAEPANRRVHLKLVPKPRKKHRSASHRRIP